MAIVATVLAASFGAAVTSTMWIVAGIATAFQVGMYLYQQSQFNTGSNSPNQPFGPLQNTKTQKLPVPIVYGEMLIAGNIFYEHFKDSKCQEVDRFFGVSVAPVESITRVQIGDKLVSDCAGCTLNIHLNTDSTTTDPLDPTSGARPYPNGIAFISTHLKAGDDVQGGDVITSIVKGKKVWTPNGTKWSDNPAWCIYDLLTNSSYGCGITLGRIDLASFISAAAYYDGVVDSGGKRFVLNYVIDTQRKAIDILGEMLAVCCSSLISRDKIRLVPDAPVLSYSKKIGMADIIEGSFVWSQKSESERYNRIVIEWCDPDNSYEQVVSIYEDTADQAIRGVIEQSVNMLGCTNVDQANRVGARILDSCMYIKEFCSFKLSLKDASIEVGDVIALTHDIPGWQDKWMRVIGLTDVDNIDDEIEVTCSEYIAEVYNDVPLDIPAHIDTNIHGTYIPDNVADIDFAEQLEIQTDGTYVNWLTVTWSNPNQNYSHLEIWYRFDADANYIAGGNIAKNAVEWRVNTAGHSRIYIKIVTVSTMGKHSTGVTAMHTITGDVTPPAAPTNINASGGYKLANITWRDPTDADLDHIDIYRSSDQSNYLKCGIAQRGEQIYTDNELGVLTTYWYKLKSIDTAGNISGFSATASATTEAIPAAAIPDYSITGKKFISDIFIDADKNAEAVIREMLTDYDRDKQLTVEISTNKSALERTQDIADALGVDITDLDIEITETQSRLGTAEQTLVKTRGVLDDAVVDITALDTRVTTAEQNITEAEQNITTLQETTTQQVTNLQEVTQRVGATETNVTNLTATVDGAVANISEISADLGETNVQVEHNVIALTSDTAQANQVAEASINDSLTLYNKDKQNRVTISEIKEILNDVTGRWGIRIDNNKRVSGIALLNGEDESNFTVLADKFLVAGNGADDEVIPVFEVDTQTGKAYLKGDLIADGSIVGSKIFARSTIQLSEGGQVIIGDGGILQIGSGAIMLNSENGTISARDPDNLTTGDFVDINTGDISTFRYIDGAYREMKSLRSMDYGSELPNGVQIELNGYWANLPNIIVSPCALQTYNAASPGQNQELYLQASDIHWKNNDASTGKVIFTPQAQLQFGAGSDSHDMSSAWFNAAHQSGVIAASGGGRGVYLSEALIYTAQTSTFTVNAVNVKNISFSLRAEVCFADFVTYSSYNQCTGDSISIPVFYALSGYVDFYIIIDGAETLISTKSLSASWGTVTLNVAATKALTPRSTAHSIAFKIRLRSRVASGGYYYNGTSALVLVAASMSPAPSFVCRLRHDGYTVNYTGSSVLASGTVNYLAIAE